VKITKNIRMPDWLVRELIETEQLIGEEVCVWDESGMWWRVYINGYAFTIQKSRSHPAVSSTRCQIYRPGDMHTFLGKVPQELSDVIAIQYAELHGLDKRTAKYYAKYQGATTRARNMERINYELEKAGLPTYEKYTPKATR